MLDELLAIVNVPTGVWIDERGHDRAPARAGVPLAPAPAERGVARASCPPLAAEQLREAQKIRIDPESLRGRAARLGGARRGSSTRCPRRRWSPARGRATTTARRRRPRFELGQHLQRTGHPEDAVAWFREAHRLQPENWTYKRQAWSLADPLQGPTDDYDSDWLTEVRTVGPENYYPAVELE